MLWKLPIVILALLAADAKEDAVKKDSKALEGNWTVVAAEQNGQPLDRITGTMKLKDLQFAIVTKSGTEMKGDFQVDPTKKPKHIDLAHTAGLLRDKTWKAIYELDGDELKLCYVDPDAQKDRPDEFKTAQDSGRLLVVLKREKK